MTVISAGRHRAERSPFCCPPHLRAARPRRLTKYQQGYQTALAEVAALGTAKAIQQWVADSRVTVEA